MVNELRSIENNLRTILHVEQISLHYGGKRIFKKLDLDVREGEILGIIGRVGSGKTRLLRMIAGLEAPQEGKIEFFSPASSSTISYVFQNDTLIPWLTVKENLDCCRRSVETRELAGFSIADWSRLKPFQLSGGMRQKVNFARGLLNRDPLVLMDEPFSAFDPWEKKSMQKAFLGYQAEHKLSALFVTHDIREALLLCHRVALLSAREGKIVSLLTNEFQGIFDEQSLFASESYRRMYQSIVEFYDREGGSI